MNRAQLTLAGARISLLALLVAAALHAATFLFTYPTWFTTGVVFLFFPIVFVVFGGMILHLNAIVGLGLGSLARRFTWEQIKTARKETLRVFTRAMPKPVLACAFAIFIYSWLSFWVVGSEIGPGVAGRRGERFVLESRGQILEYISEARFRRQNTLEVRQHSGGLLVFLGLSAAYFNFVAPRIAGKREPTRCPACGFVVPEGARYCQRCGSPLPGNQIDGGPPT